MSYCGEDLLYVFNTLNIDLRKLSPTVIKAWFDTDCKKTSNLLEWMCYSLADINYVSPLEKTEYDELEKHFDEKGCIAELSQLDFSYIDILDADHNETEIMLMEDEIQFLEEENKTLDQLLKSFENLNNNLSTELTHKTKDDIQSLVECKKAQEECIILCSHLDETIIKIQKRFLKYDPDENFVNFIDIQQYENNIEYFNSLLIPLMEIDKTCLEISDDAFTDSLEVCKKRIVHSQQIYLGNRIEIETCKEIETFLDKMCISQDNIDANFLNDTINFETKEIYKKRLYNVLDNMIVKIADHHLKQTKIRYVQSELKDYQQKSENITNIYGCVLKFLCYYILTNCLQGEDRKDIEYVNGFYQKLVRYVNDDLLKCQQRTNHMKNIINSYTSNINPKTNVMQFISKIFNSEDFSLKNMFDCVEKFKTELNGMENQIFSIDIKDEMEKLENMHEDINTLDRFLRSGPTKRVILIPVELEDVWLEIEDHIKKESASVQHAVQVPQIIRKNVSKTQASLKQLWMNFLTNPSKIDAILKQAEEDFKKRTAQYF